MNKVRIIFFHKQTFLLLFALFSLWYTIDAFYGYAFSEENLKSYQGTIIMLSDTLKQQTEDYRKGVIMLNSEPHAHFKVNDFEFYKKYIL